MQKLFSPTPIESGRDRAIETTCQNLIMATVLRPEEVASLMSKLTGYTDVQLGIALIESRLLLDNYLENCGSKN